MEIDRKLDGADLCHNESSLFIALNPEVAEFRRRNGPMITCTRVGITQAAHLQLRFYLDHSEFISRRNGEEAAARDLRH
jgi:3-methyladenine DNA glycosylase Mpg